MKTKYFWGLVACQVVFFLQIVCFAIPQMNAFVEMLALFGFLVGAVIFGSKERKKNDDKHE